MSAGMRRDEAWYREQCARNDRFKVGTADDQAAADALQASVNRPAADTPAAPPPASGGASKREPLDTDSFLGASKPYSSKYKNKPTNGYASIKESKRAFQLKLMQEAGQIRNLREQVSYLLIPKQEGERACSYVADFVYDEYSKYADGPWRPVVEDCKGMKTDVYRIKRKLMLFVHKIRIRET